MSLLSSFECLANPANCVEGELEKIIEDTIIYVIIGAVLILGIIGLYYGMEYAGERSDLRRKQ